MATKYDTIDAYIASLPDGVQLIVEAICGTIREIAPEAVEAMKYDMPTFRMQDTYVIYLAAWKKHIGLYPVYRGDAAFEAEVGPYRDKKDTVKFMLNQPIPHAVIRLIVETRVAGLRARATGSA